MSMTGRPQAANPAYLRQLVQEIEVFRCIAPRESSHLRVTRRIHGQATADCMKGVRRARIFEAIDVVAERQFIHERPARKIFISARVDKRIHPTGSLSLGRLEVAGGQRGIGRPSRR